jgi:acyl-coenzyme A synthetase/AMP-(fatty) acid ligase
VTLAGDRWPELDPEDLERPIGDRFAAVVRAQPEALAVRTPDRGVTYGELDLVVNRLAGAMGFGASRRAPVALLFEDGVSFVAASLAVLKTGRIQVPLEPTVTPADLATRLRHSGAELILTDTRRLLLARELAGTDVRFLDADAIGAEGPSASPVASVSPDTPAAIEYTSGSTGEPKGIVRSQRAVLHDVWRHQRMARLTPRDRFLIPRLTLLGHLRALLTGAAFYPAILRPDTLAGAATWMVQERITVCRAAVSAFRSLTNVLPADVRLSDLRLVVLYGEPMHQSDLDAFRTRLPQGSALVGTLGAAEFGDYGYFSVGDTAVPGGIVPGGYPAEDVEVLILDADGRPVAPGEPGELAVRSRHVAIGYWNRPDLTAAAFLDDPDGGDRRIYRTGDLGRVGPDGCLFHLGRKDRQVKVSGHRVALPAVETALRSMNGVKDAAVVAHEGVPGVVRLVAYVVPDEGAGPTLTDLRRGLEARLPAHMVPARFVALDALPLTPTGKIDRRALPAPGAWRPEIGAPFVPPESPLETEIAGIWASALGLEAVGLRDGFLELGGNSLLASQIVAAVLARFAIEIPLDRLLGTGTVAEMADVVLDGLVRARGTDDVTSRLAEMGGEAAP